MKKSLGLLLLGVLLCIGWASAVFPVSKGDKKFLNSFQGSMCRPAQVGPQLASAVEALDATHDGVDLSIEKGKVGEVSMTECFDVEGGGPRVILSLPTKKKTTDIVFFASTSLVRFNIEESAYIEADGVSIGKFKKRGGVFKDGFSVKGPIETEKITIHVKNNMLSVAINERLDKMASAAREVMLRVGSALVNLCDAKTEERNRNSEDKDRVISACSGIVRIPHNSGQAPEFNEMISGFVRDRFANIHRDDIDWDKLNNQKDEYMLAYLWKMLLSWCRLSIDLQEKFGALASEGREIDLEEFKNIGRNNKDFFGKLYPLIEEMLDDYHQSDDRMKTFVSFVRAGIAAYIPKTYDMVPPIKMVTFSTYLSETLPQIILAGVEVPLNRQFLDGGDEGPIKDGDDLSLGDVDVHLDGEAGESPVGVNAIANALRGIRDDETPKDPAKDSEVPSDEVPSGIRPDVMKGVLGKRFRDEERPRKLAGRRAPLPVSVDLGQKNPLMDGGLDSPIGMMDPPPSYPLIGDESYSEA